MAGERYSEPKSNPKVAAERLDLQNRFEGATNERSELAAKFAADIEDIKDRMSLKQEKIDEKFGNLIAKLNQKCEKEISKTDPLKRRLEAKILALEREIVSGKYDTQPSTSRGSRQDRLDGVVFQDLPNYNTETDSPADQLEGDNSYDDVVEAEIVDGGNENEDDDLYEDAIDAEFIEVDNENEARDETDPNEYMDENLENVPESVQNKRARLQRKLDKVLARERSIEDKYAQEKNRVFEKELQASLAHRRAVVDSIERLEVSIDRERKRLDIFEENLVRSIVQLDREISFGVHDLFTKKEKIPEGEITYQEYLEQRPTEQQEKFAKSVGSLLFDRRVSTGPASTEMPAPAQESTSTPDTVTGPEGLASIYDSMTLVQIIKELAAAKVRGEYFEAVQDGAISAAEKLIRSANKGASESQIRDEMINFNDRVDLYASKLAHDYEPPAAATSTDEDIDSESSATEESVDIEPVDKSEEDEEIDDDLVSSGDTSEVDEDIDEPESTDENDSIGVGEDIDDSEKATNETEDIYDDASGLDALDSMLEDSEQARGAQSVEASTEAKGAWGKFKEGLKSLRTYGASSYWGYKWDEARRGVGKALNNVLNIGVNGEMSFEEAEKVRKRNRHVMVAGAAVVVGVGMVMRLQAGGSIASASPGESLDQILPLGPDSPMDTNMQDMLPYQDGIGDSGASGINGPEGLPAEADIDIVDKDKILWNESSSGESLDVDPAEAQAEEVPAPNNETTWNESTNENSTSDNTSADNDTLWPEQLPTDLPDVKEGEGGISYFERNGLTEQAWYDHEQELLEKFGGDGGDFYQMGDGHVGLSRAGQLSLETQTYINGLK